MAADGDGTLAVNRNGKDRLEMGWADRRERWCGEWGRERRSLLLGLIRCASEHGWSAEWQRLAMLARIGVDGAWRQLNCRWV